MGTKHDPKYQTLPYNTKFGVRQQHNQHYNQILGHNQLCVSTQDTDRTHSHLQNEKILSTNSSLNNDNNNNSNHNNNVSIITNNINSNTKLAINAKSPLLEERPSPSGSSGSSDRASLANHNGYLAYKMHQQLHNSVNNMTSGHHPYQNVNPKNFNPNYMDHNQSSLSKPSKLSYNSANSSTNIANNSMNCKPCVIHNHSVPTNIPNQTQSQNTSITSKVPPNTKPKPIVPPKPSVPVKPIPPPRQSPNHLFSAQNDSLDINTYPNIRNNNNSYSKQGTNLLTTSNAPINTSTSGYKRYAFIFTDITTQTGRYL